MARSMHSCTHVLATSFYLSWLGLGAAKQCMQRRSTAARPPLLPSYLAAALLCLDRAGPPVTDTAAPVPRFWLTTSASGSLLRAWTLRYLLPPSSQLVVHLHACMGTHRLTQSLAHHTQHTVPVPHTDTHPPLLNLSLHKTLAACLPGLLPGT